MKMNKRFLSFLLTFVMLLTLGVSTAWANNDAMYLVDDRAPYPTGTINVHVKIMGYGDGNIFFDKELTIKGNSIKSVKDALQAAVDDKNSNLTIQGLNDGYVSKINGQSYGEAGTYSGWVFRVNHMVPVEAWHDPAYGTPRGATINTTYLKNGDQLYMWYDTPESTRYTRVNASKNGTKYTVTAQSSYNDNLWDFSFTNFTPLTTGNIVLVDMDTKAIIDTKPVGSVFDVSVYPGTSNFGVYYQGINGTGGAIDYVESLTVPLK